MKHTLYIGALIAALLLAGGCGQKGPLVPAPGAEGAEPVPPEDDLAIDPEFDE